MYFAITALYFKPLLAWPKAWINLAMSVEDDNTILTLAKLGTTLKTDLEVKTKFHTKYLQGFIVIAEIPGTDPLLKDEVEMIEAMHIINTIGASPKRIINTGSTDHIAFDALVLPGGHFIQDPVEYSSRVLHYNMDVYDHLIQDHLK